MKGWVDGRVVRRRTVVEICDVRLEVREAGRGATLG